MIYGLVHPDTLEVRYVGKARDAAARLKQHRANAARIDYPVYRWWRKVVDQAGYEPGLVRLGEGDSAEEIAMIAKLRADGAPLLNCTGGGENFNPSPEVREKISSSLRGRTLSPEHKGKISVGLQGNSNTRGKWTPKQQAAREAANTPEVRE